MSFLYRFSAVRGIQANKLYYICMVPCKLLEKLFVTETEDILPEYRAQRKLNINRIPVIKNYILDNRKTYVFSALSASINGSFSFIATDASNTGTLEVDMDSTFLINDGQHRKAALEEAIMEDPTLGEETISIVFFEDQGLAKSQQMFTDLNKHAVNTSKSLNTLYDSNNKIAVFTKTMVSKVLFFSLYTDKERDTLGKFSKMLFTLNNFYVANERLFSGMSVNEKNSTLALGFWGKVAESINEWNELKNREITKRSLRENFIVTQGVVLLALGKLGNYLLKNEVKNYKQYLSNLSDINWLRTNPMWNGRTLREGRIDRREKSINLTYIKIKELIGIELTSDEKILNKSV